MASDGTELALGDQDFQAPEARHTGAGTAGLLELTDLDRSERLTRMREGSLGSIHSWELVTAVDGPGTRMTIFLSGCPLRCLYCHNPDTMAMRNGEPIEADELLRRIRRYRKIFRTTGGGITLSGGEVLMQPAFAARLLRGAKEMGIHTALDTSGFLGAAATDDHPGALLAAGLEVALDAVALALGAPALGAVGLPDVPCFGPSTARSGWGCVGAPR